MKPTILENLSEHRKERLRQERETFDQHRTQEHRWFNLRLRMGYVALVMLPAILLISALIIWNAASFPASVVTAATVALFTDIVGLFVSVWKVVLNPDFMTKLAPVTQLQEQEDKSGLPPGIEDTPLTNNELFILDAQYGAGEIWYNATEVLRINVKENILRFNVTNTNIGCDPVENVRKILKVTYTYGGVTYSKIIGEDETLELPEV